MFGAWAPLPLRLGPDAQRGWSAGAQSRLASDLAAAKRTVPLARVTLAFDGIATYTITDYVGQNGTGLGSAPTNIGGSLKWATTYPDYAGNVYPWRIRHVRFTPLGSAPMAVQATLYTGGADVTFAATDLSGAGGLGNTGYEITVYGDWLPERQIGDYDGATDKENSQTEGDSSYFYDWFLELQAMRGSAYSKGPGFVDAENFAIARQLGSLSRNAEKFENNSLPGTSDEKLEYWLDVLGIPQRTDLQRWQLRQRAETKLRAAAVDNNPTNIDDAIRALLGSACIAIHRNIGSLLSAPPAITYWPGVNPGPASYSLGGGAWLSERSHLWVEVQQPTTMSDLDFRRLINVDLFELLDLRLPAHMTFGVATTSGFLLDISQLDFDGL